MSSKGNPGLVLASETEARSISKRQPITVFWRPVSLGKAVEKRLTQEISKINCDKRNKDKIKEAFNKGFRTTVLEQLDIWRNEGQDVEIAIALTTWAHEPRYKAVFIYEHLQEARLLDENEAIVLLFRYAGGEVKNDRAK